MMWEVYSRCTTDPYPGSTNAESKVAILSGNVMAVPQDTPQHAAEIMRSCWLKNPDDRPGFTEIVSRLDRPVGSPQQK